MKYNDITNKNGLLQHCEMLTGLGDAGISGDTLLKARFTMLLNQKLHLVGSWIWQADRAWDYDDKNYSNMPWATATLVNNQRDYVMPTALLRIKKVEIMKSDGNYYDIKLLRKGIKSFKYKTQQEDAGLPTHYYMQGNTLLLHPKINISLVTATAGIRVWLDRYADVFVVGDTDQEPGFAVIFHQILSLLASAEWAGIKGLGDVVNYCEGEVFGTNKKAGLKAELIKHYANRYGDELTPIARVNFHRSQVE